MAASASKAFTVSKLDVLASSVSYRSFGTSASAFASPGYSDGGYRTGDDSPSADNPDCSAFSFDEDEVDLFSSELIDEMDNEVFDQETDEEGGDTEGENIEVLRRDVVPLRTRALSFPFTLADVRFSLTFPVASMGYPDSAMKKEFSLKSWWESKSGNCNKQFKGEEKENGDVIDSATMNFQNDCNSSKNTVHLQSFADGSAASIGRRRTNLPDLVLSGDLSSRRLNRRLAPNAADVSRCTDIEYQIACRLATIGDEFDVKFFNASDAVNCPRSGRSLAELSLTSAAHVWNYLSKTASGLRKPALRRQRSYSTAEQIRCHNFPTISAQKHGGKQ